MVYRQRLYLKVGDRVEHTRHTEWGVGTVVEARTSTLPGGICMVRILFEDEEERSFINDLDNEMCCRRCGIIYEGEAERAPRQVKSRKASQSRLN